MKQFKLKTLLLSVCLLMSFVAYSADGFDKCKEVLERTGYTDVVSTGHCGFCCDETDANSYGFICKDKTGKVVKGCMCIATNATVIAWD